jgi:hypothetical protein
MKKPTKYNWTRDLPKEGEEEGGEVQEETETKKDKKI